jgi:hypothetical protein
VWADGIDKTLRVKLGGTSMVRGCIPFVLGLSDDASRATSCETWRMGLSDRGAVPVIVPAEASPSPGAAILPGSVLSTILDITILPSRSSNRASRLTCFWGPPTASHGSQKL